jgi:hypothetical protein
MEEAGIWYTQNRLQPADNSLLVKYLLRNISTGIREMSLSK